MLAGIIFFSAFKVDLILFINFHSLKFIYFAVYHNNALLYCVFAVHYHYFFNTVFPYSSQPHIKPIIYIFLFINAKNLSFFFGLGFNVLLYVSLEHKSSHK